MTEFEAMKEFRDSGAVVGINRILNKKRNEMSQENRDWAIEKLIQYSRSAMAKAGIELTADGKEDFPDAVFFDMQMTNEVKIELLEMCEGQQARIDVLRAEIAQ